MRDILINAILVAAAVYLAVLSVREVIGICFDFAS